MSRAAVPLTTILVAAAVVTIEAQSPTFVRVAAIAGPADLVEVQGNYAYIAAGKTLSIVDIRDATAPKRVGAYTFPELIWGITLDGDTAYVAADTYGLGLLDISDPAAPRLRGALRTPGQAKSVAFTSNRAFVADHVRGIDVVTLAPPASPQLTGSYFVDGFAKDVVARGRLLYAIDQPNGFNVFDVSDAGALEPVAALTLSNPIPLRAQLDVSAAEARTRLAIVVGGGPLQIYDVTDAKAPKLATSYRTPGAAQRVALQGTDLYVADGPRGLQVLDLSAPSTPTIRASFATPAPARDVAVSGPLVLVVSGSEDVLILRRSSQN